MAAAETGSGKTGAFALPILQIVHETLTTGSISSKANTQRCVQTPLHRSSWSNLVVSLLLTWTRLRELEASTLADRCQLIFTSCL